MLAGVLERLLKSYLSRWLSVTASHLQVLQLGVWSGNLHFEQLHMLSSVLDELKLPLGLGVKLKKGMIGTLQLKCNWTRLTTQPVEVSLSDVYLLGEIDPTRMDTNMDPSRAAEEIAQLIHPDVIRTYIQSQKQQIIQAAESTWEQFKSESNDASQSYMSALTASLVASILDNLSVTVQRIHVCIATMPRADTSFSTINPAMTAPPSAAAASTAAATHTQPSPRLGSESPEIVAMQTPPDDTTGTATSSSSSSTLSSPPSAPPAIPSSPPPFPRPAEPPQVSSFPMGWSLGVLLNELSFRTTDKSGEATFVKSTGDNMHKRVRLEGLAVYLSSNATPLPDAAAGSDEYFMTIMAKPFKKAIDDNAIDGELSDPDSSSRASSLLHDGSDADSADSDSSDDDAPSRSRVASVSASPVIVPAAPTGSHSSPHHRRTHHTSGAQQQQSKVEQVDGLEYILCPCDATVKLRFRKANHQRDGGVTGAAGEKKAKMSVRVEVENLQLEFTSKQYEIIQSLAGNISSSEHALRHAPFIAPTLRPGHSDVVTRAWWSYALSVTRHECKQRLQQWDPKFIQSYRRDFHAYTPLYTAFIAGKSTAHQRASMHRLEEPWEAHHIIMWRSLIQKTIRIKEAMAHVSKARGKKKAKGRHGGHGGVGDGDSNASSGVGGGGGGSIMGWLGSFLPGGSSDSGDAADADSASLRLSEEEREQILEMLGYDPYAPIEQLSLQATENTMKIELALGKASITLFQATIASEPSQVDPFRPRIDQSTLPGFPLVPRSLTTRRAFLHASLYDFHILVHQRTTGVSVELSLDHLLVEDRMASCERFSALIVPRAQHQARQQQRRIHGNDATPSRTPMFQTPNRLKGANIESSPLMLPGTAEESSNRTNSSAGTDQRQSSSFTPGSPDFGLLTAPEPPLVQMRLSYHFPSVHLASSASASQAHVDLWLATQPLDVVYSAGVISSLKSFLLTDAAVANPSEGGFDVLWQELEVAAMNAFLDLKRRSAAKLEYVLHHHVRIGLDVNIQAPTLLIYHHDASDIGSCLAINLGHVTCATQQKQTATVVEPDEADTRKGSIDMTASSTIIPSAWGASMEAAAARERALSAGGADTGSGATAISPEARQQLFYDQFHLTIENMDVQLIPLQYDSRTGRDSVPGSGMFGPNSDPASIPTLHLPATAHAPYDSATAGAIPSPGSHSANRSAKRGSSRRTWLARRRHLQSRTNRASVWGCGPVVDAFTPTLHVLSSVLPSDTSLPRMKIHAHLPPLKLHLSSAKMRRILDILSSFPNATPAPTHTLPQSPHMPPMTRAGSMGGIMSSPSLAPTRADSKSSAAANRRSSSSFQISKESAMATAAQMAANDSKEKESKGGSSAPLPADWVMLNFHLTASQLAIELSFDCDLPPDQIRHANASPGYGAQPPIESTIDLVSFLLEGVELSFTQFPYSFALETQVHGLFVEDCINREHLAYRYLISSGSSPSVEAHDKHAYADEVDLHRSTIGSASSISSTAPAAAQSAITDLIYLRFHHATDSSPHATATSVDNLQVEFNTLQFNYNRSTFQLLMEFLQPVIDAMDSPSALPDPHLPHHHTNPSDLSDADTVILSRSADFSSMSQSAHLITNLSASTGSLPTPTAAHTPSHVPATPDRHATMAAQMSTPLRSVSGLSIHTPSIGGSTVASSATATTQQDLLARMNDKIANDGEIGSRANKFGKLQASSSSIHIHASINLISLSLNTEKDDAIGSIARTEIQGLDVSVKNENCPCGGCLQVDAKLANLTLFEITTNASDTFSNYSRRSDARSARMPYMSRSQSSASMRDSFSPHPSETASMRGVSGSGSGTGSTQSFGSSHTRARRIASKRHDSDTALVSFSFTQHSLLMDAPHGQPSSATCPIRYRTIRNPSHSPPVDPATLSFDQTIAVDVSSIQVVFVPEFIVRLQSYLEESILKEASDRAAEKAKAAFTELKQMAEAKCNLLKYHVSIDNPLIFLPHTTMAPINHPIHSPMSPPSPRDSFMHMHAAHLYDDVRAVTDYLVLDLGKISLANQFALSEERHHLIPPTTDEAMQAGMAVLPSPTSSSALRRRRKSVVGYGRMPSEQVNLRLSAMNLILASPPRVDPSIDSSSSPSLPASDDAGLFWSVADKIKIFEDVDVNVGVNLVMLVPHLAFVDVPNVQLTGTVSTIQAHISEQLLTFLIGVYTVELAPLLTPAPSPATTFEAEVDDMMEIEFEQEEIQPACDSPRQPARHATLTPKPQHAQRAPSTDSSSSLSSADADADAALSADAMASIDEEFDDEDDDAAMPLTSTTEIVGMTVELSFEGVVLDLMLTPAAATSEEDNSKLRANQQPAPAATSGAFFSPGASAFQPPASAFQTPAGPLNGFSFAPVQPLQHPMAWWNQPQRQAASFVQLSARTLNVSFKLTNVVRLEVDSDPLRSALTSVELSLGHLSLDDMRSECTHPLLKQVIGGHHDAMPTQNVNTSGATRAKERAGSVAFDLAAGLMSPIKTNEDTSSAAFTVLPDLKVKFESLAVERAKPLASDAVEFDLDTPSSSRDHVTVEMSVDVEFTAPRLVISPNFLAAVMGFVDAYAAVIEANVNNAIDNGHAHGHAHAHANAIHASATPAAVDPDGPSSGVETRIYARIRDPQVWLMSDADVLAPSAATFAPSPTLARDTQRDSSTAVRPLSCIVLRGNLELTLKLSHSTSLHATVSDIEALMCYRANQLRLAQLNPLPVPVFQPFAVRLEYQLRHGPKGDEFGVNESNGPRLAYPIVAQNVVPTPPPVAEHHLTVDVGRLDSCFSFLQISSAANIILAILQSFPTSDPPVGSKSMSNAADVAAKSPVAFLAAFKGVAQLRTSGIHLKLVNDAPGYYVPLLSFSIHPLVLSVLDPSHPDSIHAEQLMEKNSGSVPTYLPASRFTAGIARSSAPRQGAALLITTGIQANYYNQQLGEFEKFLDTWLFDVRAEENTIVLSSKQVLDLQITPSCMHALAQGMDSLQTHFLSVVARRPIVRRNRSVTRVASKVARGSILQANQPAPTAHAQDRKASYFRVRNETGSRIRFWSVELEQSGVAAPAHDDAHATLAASAKAASAIFTVEPNHEQTVALRQYIGVGGFGLDHSDSSSSDSTPGKLRWLYRSPMVGLQVEAGSGSDRWHAWQSISAVPLVASSAEAPVETTRKAAARNRLHAHANLTLHPLLPSPDADLSPYDDDRDEVAGGVIACHLVSQTDSDGSSAQVLVVSSALLLVNRTFIDVEICLVDTLAESVLFQREVLSGQSLPMPVLLVPWRRVKLLVRPARVSFKKMEWEWSTAGFRLSMLQHEAANHTILKCKPHTNAQPISPLQQATSHSTVASDIFCCGLNIFSTSATSDIAQTDATASMSQLGGGAGIDGSIDPTLYTIALDPPLSFKNLLGCEVAYQVTLRERRQDATYIRTPMSEMDITGVQAGTLMHREEVHWYHMDLGASSSAVVTLQLKRSHATRVDLHSRVPTPRSSVSRSASYSHLLHLIDGRDHAVGDWSDHWSSEVVIHSTTASTQPAHTLVMQDSEGGKLGVQLDYSATPHQDKIKSASASTYPYAHAGHGLVTASVPYWFANHSGLPLIYASVDERESDMICQCAGQSHHSLQHAAQALMDLEGVDELAQRSATVDGAHSTGAAASIGAKNQSWFHFSHARREFGRETRAGLQALLEEHDDDATEPAHRTSVTPDWQWTPDLARRPLDENVFLLSPLGSREEELELQQQVEVYMLPSRRGEKLRAVIRLPHTDWSQPFNVDTVGWDGALQLTEQPRPTPSENQPKTDSAYELPPPTDRPLRVYSLGVTICMHAHLRYHRTKIIQFSPRYVLSNQTLHTLEFRQTDSQEVRTIAPKQQVPIHWLDQGGRAALSLRVGSYGWQWAAKRFGIALESVGVFSVRLRNSHTHDTAVLHVWIKLVGATFEITILATWEQQQRKIGNAINDNTNMQTATSNINASVLNTAPYMLNGSFLGAMPGTTDLNSSMTGSVLLGGGVAAQLGHAVCADDRDLQDKIAAETGSIQEPVPYRIENCSLRTLLFHQSDEPKLKQRLLPFQSCPYAWDEPMGHKEIVLFCLSGMGANSLHDDAGLEEQRVGSYSLDKIARYDPVWLRARRTSPGQQEMQVQDQVIAQVYADGRVRVLKLVELTSASLAGLNPIQASLNSQAADPSSLTSAVTGWSVEVRLAGLGLSLITHVHRAATNATQPANATSSTMRPTNLIGQSATNTSSHPLALLGSPYTRQELLYLSIQNIRFRLNESNTNQALKAAIGHIQLDNQLHSAVYPVVLCSVSKPHKSTGWFSSKKKSTTMPDLDLDDDFFQLHGGGSSALLATKGRIGRATQKDGLPCWLSISLLKSHDRSTSDFLFLPGLAVRMQLLKINVEEKLINHLIRFSELLGPAIALLSKPSPVTAHTSDEHIGMSRPHQFDGAQTIERQTSQTILDMALHEDVDFASPLPSHPSRYDTHSIPTSDIGEDIGSLSPNSLNGSSILGDDYDDDDPLPSHQFTGIVGRRVLPSAAAPLSSLEYSRLATHHSSRIDRDRADSEATEHAQVQTAVVTTPRKLERLYYFQYLLVETIEIQVSMSSSGDQDDALSGVGNHPLRVLLRVVGATLLNFEDASLKFGSLDLPDVFASGGELAALVAMHYAKQATRQAYHLLGSSDFLGNPVALFGAISTGFGELVYQPVAGLTQSPAGVVTGALGGVRSFAQHAIYGVTSATRSILSSVGKGLSSASMSDHPNRAGQNMRLAELPMRGWKRGGYFGFIGGTLRAALGLAGRMAHSLSSGVDRIRALVNPIPKLLRAREPLFFQSGMKPRLYHIDVARFVVAYLAMHLEETFVACIEQDAPQTPAAAAAAGIPAVRTLSGHILTVQNQSTSESQATSSTSTSASASTPSIPLATPVRAPIGARICVLLTTHTLVVFCVFPLVGSRRSAQLLREIPLEVLTTPVLTDATHTTLTLEPVTIIAEHERRQPRRKFRGMRHPQTMRRNQPTRQMPPLFPVPNILRSWMPFFFGPSPSDSNESISLPVRFSDSLVAELTFLATAARTQRDATLRQQLFHLTAMTNFKVL